MANNSLDALNMNVLNVARDEYTAQLNKILTPLVLDGIISLYNDSGNTDGEDDPPTGVKRIIRFQRLLQNVPLWNQKIINDECDRIRQICSWVEQLTTAVFVTHVKILTSVKLNKESKHFNFSVPNFENFIHNVYINTAKSVFMKPYNVQMYYESNNFKANRECVNDIEKAVEDSVRELLPVQEILNTYMATDTDGADLDSESDGTDTDDEASPGTQGEEEEEEEVKDFNINENGVEVIPTSPAMVGENGASEEQHGEADIDSTPSQTDDVTSPAAINDSEITPPDEALQGDLDRDDLDDDIKELGSNFKSYNPKDQ